MGKLNPPPIVCRWGSPQVSPASRVAFLPDGCLVVGRANGTLDLLTAEHLTLTERLYGSSTTNIRTIHVLEQKPFNARYILTAGLHGKIDLWSVDLARIILSVNSLGGAIFDSAVIEKQSEVLIYIACEDGSVREFALEVEPATTDKRNKRRLNPTTDRIEIVFKQCIAREPGCQILSLCLRNGELYFGTSNSTMLKWDLKTNSTVHKMVLPHEPVAHHIRKLRKTDASRKEQEDKLEEGENVFDHLDKTTEASGSDSIDSKMPEVQVLRLIYCPADDAIICGDSNGRVTSIDPSTCTILSEFKCHEAPVTDLLYIGAANGDDVLLSTGVDGRLVAYIRHGDVSRAVSAVKMSTRIVGFVRYVHEVEAVSIVYHKKKIVVAGSDGALAVFRDGIFDIQELSKPPERISALLALRGCKSGGYLQASRSEKIQLEVLNHQIRVWSLAANSDSPSVKQSILADAQARLKLPETKAGLSERYSDECSTAASESSPVTSSKVSEDLIPVKLAEILFTHPQMNERLIDACFVDLSMLLESRSVYILALTDRKLRLFKLDLVNVRVENITTVVPSDDNSSSSLNTLNFLEKCGLGASIYPRRVLSLGRDGLCAITFTKVLEDGKVSHGFWIVSAFHSNPLTRVEDLTSPITSVDFIIPDSSDTNGVSDKKSTLLVKMVSQRLAIFQVSFSTSSTGSIQYQWKSLSFVTQIAVPQDDDNNDHHQSGNELSCSSYCQDDNVLYTYVPSMGIIVAWINSLSVCYLYSITKNAWLPTSSKDKGKYHYSQPSLSLANDNVGISSYSLVLKSSVQSNGKDNEIKLIIVRKEDVVEMMIRVIKKTSSFELISIESVFQLNSNSNRRSEDEEVFLGGVEGLKSSLILSAVNVARYDDIGPAPLARKRYAAM